MIDTVKDKLEKLLDNDLHILFTDKQVKIIYAKVHGKSLSKTDEEYFSRVIKKKLSALMNSDLQNIAKVTTK